MAIKKLLHGVVQPAKILSTLKFNIKVLKDSISFTDLAREIGSFYQAL